MAKGDVLIDSLFYTVKEAFFYHRNRLNELQFKDHPFDEIRSFINILMKIDYDILKHLESESLKVEPESETYEESLIKLRRFGLLAATLHSIFSFLEVSRREYIPQGTVDFIKNIMEKQQDNDTKIILLPLSYYNYAYQKLITPLKQVLRDVLPDVESYFSNFANELAIIGFPLIQKENILQNSLLAHEIGHHISEKQQIVSQLMEKVSIDTKILESIVREYSEKGIPRENGRSVPLTFFISLERLKADLSKTISKTIQNWLAELSADAIAFHLLGPAYLFALVMFLLSLKSPEISSDKYPPPRMRLNLLIEEMVEMKFIDVLNKNKDGKKLVKFLESIKDLLSNIKEEEKSKTEKLLYNLIHKSVSNIIPELKKKVNIILNGKDYTAENFKNEVFTLISILDAFVTPVETSSGNPASLESIINAGMLYNLLFIENLYKALDAKTMEDKLYVKQKVHQLILKALELSSIESSFKKIRGEMI